MQYLETFKILKESIFHNDFIILIVAIVAAVFMITSVILKNAIKKRVKEWKEDKNTKFTAFLLHGLGRTYTLFTTMITVFPLLGMLGTVSGLLGLDLASGDMNNIKANFFVALTSTAWGIIFSVIFKIANAFISDDVEEHIEIAKKLSDELGI